MENIEQLLSKNHLFSNQREALIYTTLLKNGPLGAEKLKDLTGLHRETIQRELKKMAVSGTINLKQHGRNKKAYSVSLSLLQEKIDKEYDSFNLLLKPLLEVQAGQKMPKIDIYTGSHKFGLLQMRLIKLQPPGQDIRVISTQPKSWIENMIESQKLSQFENLRTKKRINFLLSCFSQYRGQVESNNREYFAYQPERLKRKYRYVETELNSPLQIQVWFGHVLISIFDSYPSIHILIEDSRIVTAMKSYFEIIWRGNK